MAIDPVKAFIFDLDGTLVDTEPLHHRAWDVVLGELGRPFPEGEYVARWGGRPGREIARDFLGIGPAEAERVTDLVIEAFWEITPGNVAPHRGVLDLLARYQGVPRAVATSAKGWSAARLLEEVGLAGAFDAVVTADDIRHGKPDPEIFLTAASRLGVDPANCLVFEDAPAGVAAAGAAGMRCIGIATLPRPLDGVEFKIDDFHDERLASYLGERIPE